MNEDTMKWLQNLSDPALRIQIQLYQTAIEKYRYDLKEMKENCRFACAEERRRQT